MVSYLLCSLFISKSLQKASLKELGENLKDHKVTLSVDYSSTLHDREVRYMYGNYVTDIILYMCN